MRQEILKGRALAKAREIDSKIHQDRLKIHWLTEEVERLKKRDRQLAEAILILLRRLNLKPIEWQSDQDIQAIAKLLDEVRHDRSPENPGA